MNARQLARGLGLFSLGLGLVETAAPGKVSRALGVKNGNGSRVLRAFGSREMATGIGLLAAPSPAWLWARVGGDALDLAGLGWAMYSNKKRSRLAMAAGAVAAVTAADVLCARMLKH